MYRDFWGFRHDPFSLIADTPLVCRSRQHNQALASLIYTVDSRKGLIVLTAEPGMGKTTLLYCLREFLEKRGVECLFLYNSRIDPDQFWQLIGSTLAPESDCRSKIDVLNLLQDLVVLNARAGTVLIVDEAQNFSSDVLEEIRLLANLENRRGKLLQIVLAGQPELESKLEATNLRALKQRIVRRCSLYPFDKPQTQSYIHARLECAGMPWQTIFPEDVIEQIHVRSRGIPRLINTLCDNLLVTAFALDRKTATLEMLDAVSSDLRLDWDPHDSTDSSEESHQMRIGTADLIKMGVLPASFGEAAEPVRSAPTSAPKVEPARESPIRADEGTRKIRVSMRSVIEHPRVTIALLTVTLVLSGSVAFSKPIARWFRTLPAIVASLYPVRFSEMSSTEGNPVTATGRNVDAGPQPLKIEPAEYTASARSARFQGKIFVVVTVNPQGRVIHVDFTAPTAFDLDRAVREAAQRWLFKPAIRDGQIVESRTLVQVPFR